MDDEGEFVVGWLSSPPAASRTAFSTSEVLAQLFSGSPPAPDGSQIDLGTGASSASRNVSVAMDEEGDFVVGFQATGQTIQAERFAAGAKGSPLPLQLAATPEPNPSVNGLNPSVAMDPEGEVAIAWQREEAPTTTIISLPARRSSCALLRSDRQCDRRPAIQRESAVPRRPDRPGHRVGRLG